MELGPGLQVLPMQQEADELGGAGRLDLPAQPTDRQAVDPCQDPAFAPLRAGARLVVGMRTLPTGRGRDRSARRAKGILPARACRSRHGNALVEWRRRPPGSPGPVGSWSGPGRVGRPAPPPWPVPGIQATRAPGRRRSPREFRDVCRRPAKATAGKAEPVSESRARRSKEGSTRVSGTSRFSQDSRSAAT